MSTPTPSEGEQPAGAPTPGGQWLRSGRIRFLVKLGLTAAVLSLLVRVVGWRQIGSSLLDASPPLLVLMYAIALLRQVVDASQLRYLMGRVGMPFSVWRIFLASQLSSLYTLVVPGEVAASAVKWANLSKAAGKRSLVLNAMAYNKLLITAAPLLVGGCALLIDNPLGTRWALVLPVGVILGILWLMVALYNKRLGVVTDRVLRRVANRMPSTLATKVGFVLESMHQIRALPWHTHVVMVGFAGLGIVTGIIRFYVGMQALGISVSLPSVLWINAFLRLAAILPLTVGNLGVREGMLVVALSASAVPAEQAVALGLLGFSTVVLNAFIGAGYQVALTAGWADARRSGESNSERW